MADLDPLEQEALDAFGQYIDASELEDALTAEMLAAIAGALDVEPSPEIVAFARAEAAKKVKDIIKGTQEGLASIIADGIRERKGVDGIARDIRERLGLTPQRLATVRDYAEELADRVPPLSDARFQELLAGKIEQEINDRAKVIAQTEMRDAFESVHEQVAVANGSTHKVWRSTGDARVSAECQANEARGVIGLRDTFPGGVTHAPQHPRCRCSVSYLTQPDDARVAELNDKAKERSDAIEAARG